MNYSAGESRPDREPKKGDPIRDPNKNPGNVNPSPDTINTNPDRKQDNPKHPVKDK